MDRCKTIYTHKTYSRHALSVSFPWQRLSTEGTHKVLISLFLLGRRRLFAAICCFLKTSLSVLFPWQLLSNKNTTCACMSSVPERVGGFPKHVNGHFLFSKTLWGKIMPSLEYIHRLLISLSIYVFRKFLSTHYCCNYLLFWEKTKTIYVNIV